MTKTEWNRRGVQEERLAALGINPTDAETLRRCSRRLQRWGELECGDGNNWASWSLERDEETGKPFLVTRPHNIGKLFRRAYPDHEKAALRRIAGILQPLGLHFWHQTDPRGCALYVSRTALDGSNYSRGIGVW